MQNIQNMQNRRNLDPKIWGEWFWMSMYSVSYSYPSNPSSKEIMSAKEYFLSLQFLLPCGDCRDEYKKIVKQIQLQHHLLSRGDLLSWVNKVHNAVNASLGVKSRELNDVLQKLELQGSEEPPPINKLVTPNGSRKPKPYKQFRDGTIGYRIHKQVKGCKSCGSRIV